MDSKRTDACPRCFQARSGQGRTPLGLGSFWHFCAARTALSILLCWQAQETRLRKINLFLSI